MYRALDHRDVLWVNYNNYNAWSQGIFIKYNNYAIIVSGYYTACHTDSAVARPQGRGSKNPGIIFFILLLLPATISGEKPSTVKEHSHWWYTYWLGNRNWYQMDNHDLLELVPSHKFGLVSQQPLFPPQNTSKAIRRQLVNVPPFKDAESPLTC